MAKKSNGSKIIEKLLGILFLSVAIFLLAKVGIDTAGTASLQKQADQVKKELQDLKDENAALTSTKEKLEDESYVQTFARGEYMFSLEDEQIFYLPSSFK